ncbi:Mor transcription activator family protein [Thauera butanivorans]|uniref:Mor transcription activator family protein n=1 Tax=Thauera butanivorans TaxID=86174 RepID=UPI00083983AB
MKDRKRARGHEFFEVLECSLRRGLNACGVDDGAAGAVVEECVRKVRGAFGGASVYIPSRPYGLHDQRNSRMYAEFNGENQMELSRKYGVSVMRVRQIIEEVRTGRRKGKGA